MIYYLLTFNQDWADEHDVPALACMTEEEYNQWLETPSGDLNENYEEENKVFQEKVLKYNTFVSECKNRGLYTKPHNEYTEEDNKWYIENKVDYIYSRHTPKKVLNSKICAYLGNGGDGFEEKFNHLYLMKEFVDTKIVKVLKVNKDFYDVFHDAGLTDLSLCGIFKLDDY